MKNFWYALFLVFISLSGSSLVAQDGFNNKTRALYILDISKYVKFDESLFNDREEFVISVLDRDDKLYWELERLSKTRKSIQQKPIKIRLCARRDQLGSSSVVFVNSSDGYSIGHVLDMVEEQGAEIEGQKLTILTQVNDVHKHREALAEQEKRIRDKEMTILTR